MYEITIDDKRDYSQPLTMKSENSTSACSTYIVKY